MTDQQSYTVTTTPAWHGNAKQKKLAERVYQVMSLQGSFYPANVPIRQSLAHLAAFFAAQDSVEESSIAPQIEEAIKANAAIFQRSIDGDAVIYATTRLGHYTEPLIDTSHTFAQRLHDPENPLPIDDLDVVITRTRPALTTVEPVFISEYWQQRSPVNNDNAPSTPIGIPAPAATPALAGISARDEQVPARDEQAPIEQPVVTAEPVVAAKPEPAVPAFVPPPVANSTVINVEEGLDIDLAQPVETIVERFGPKIKQVLSDAIHNDPLRRIVAFGDEYFPEDAVATLSKGDLRRIREYIVEQGEPMPDNSILTDVYYKNPREGDYNSFRFALNYRLNREKDFEFVGVQGARLWSAKGLPTVGTKRLKTSELGQFYAFLEEQSSYDDSLNQLSADDIKASRQISRFLTFFEWEYGALPYDAAMKALLPQPLLPDQRTAILRIESPQHYTFHLAELRYPTANRGGWLHGLEDFFKEHLVPGALITLSATDDPSVWTLSYGETAGNEVKLLQQDDKKGRYSFVKHTYYCDVDDDLVPSQERLTRLKNMKVLAPGERRRIESTAGYVLEQVGQPRPGDRAGFELGIEDLFMGVNVQRPATRAYLRQALAEHEDFLIEDDTFIYVPPPEETATFPESTDEDE